MRRRRAEARTDTEGLSSWNIDGPVEVEISRPPGASHMWLKFSRKGFDGRVLLRLERAKAIHAQLGDLIADAEAEASLVF